MAKAESNGSVKEQRSELEKQIEGVHANQKAIKARLLGMEEVKTANLEFVKTKSVDERSAAQTKSREALAVETAAITEKWNTERDRVKAAHKTAVTKWKESFGVLDEEIKALRLRYVDIKDEDAVTLGK